MEFKQARYNFEHRLLPQTFYSNPSKLINLLVGNENELYELWLICCKVSQIENPYDPNQFKIEPFRIDDSTLAIRLTMPTPEKEVFAGCRYIFLMFEETLQKLAYYTLEENEFDADSPYICSWDSNGEHFNYGVYDGEYDLFSIIVELFRRMEK